MDSGPRKRASGMISDWPGSVSGCEHGPATAQPVACRNRTLLRTPPRCDVPTTEVANHLGRRGNQLTHKLQTLRCHLHAQLGHSRDVAAGPIETGDQARSHWIAGGGEGNRDCRGRGLGRRPGRCICNDHRHLSTNQLRRHRWQTIILAHRPAIFDRHVLTLDIACFLQATVKGPTYGVTQLAMQR